MAGPRGDSGRRGIGTDEELAVFPGTGEKGLGYPSRGQGGGEEVVLDDGDPAIRRLQGQSTLAHVLEGDLLVFVFRGIVNPAGIGVDEAGGIRIV